MRQTLYEARLHLGLPALSYAYPVLNLIHGQDIAELREGVE